VIVQGVRRLDKTPFAVSAIVLDRGGWERAGVGSEYGLPALVSHAAVAVPAEGDDAMVRAWTRWLGSDLPPLPGMPVRGTPEGASALALSDLVLQRQVASLFVDRASLAAGEPWVRRVLSHLVALTLFDRYESRRMPEIETLWRRLDGQLPVILRLMTGDTNSEEWLRDDAAAFLAALAAFRADDDALRKALKARKRKGLPLGGADLRRVLPEIDAWAAARASAAAEAASEP